MPVTACLTRDKPPNLLRQAGDHLKVIAVNRDPIRILLGKSLPRKAAFQKIRALLAERDHSFLNRYLPNELQPRITPITRIRRELHERGINAMVDT
jgi:hypothetical protein